MKKSLTPTLHEVRCKFGFVCFSISDAKSLDYQFFSIFFFFFQWIRHQSSKKRNESWFLKKSSDGLGWAQNVPKWGLQGCSKNLIHSDIDAFLLQYEIANRFLTFCKNSMFRIKSDSWVMIQKPQDQSESKIL